MTADELNELLLSGEPVQVWATLRNGRELFSGDVQPLAVDCPDGRPTLVALTDDGQAVRLPVGGAS